MPDVPGGNQSGKMFGFVLHYESLRGFGGYNRKRKNKQSENYQSRTSLGGPRGKMRQVQKKRELRAPALG